MKKYSLLLFLALFSFSCSGQKNESKTQNDKLAEEPKGSWKVDKEFDEQGNLIRYDSIYSWSSNSKTDNLSAIDKDSLLKSYKSKFFRNFSSFENQGFESIFSPDSLFSKHFFNDDFFGSDFGNDFMNIDKIRQQMIDRQKRFLEKYKTQIIPPEEEKETKKI